MFKRVYMYYFGTHIHYTLYSMYSYCTVYSVQDKATLITVFITLNWIQYSWANTFFCAEVPNVEGISQRVLNK